MEKMMYIPEKVKAIAKALEAKGFRAFLVGGCIRDAFLGKKPKDFDIATDAKPSEVMSIFDHGTIGGMKHFVLPMEGAMDHGVTFVMFGEEQFEIATFRRDLESTDHRHSTVSLEDVSIEEDMSRRDFTINAMGLDILTEELVDIFGGTEDINKGIIRAVGNPHERFNEDALRMVRAIRFAAKLGFGIEAETFKAIKDLHADVKNNISGERMQKELTAILESADPRKGFALLLETGILEDVLPEVALLFRTAQENPHHVGTVGEHTLCTLEALKKSDRADSITLWAMLLHDLGKPATKAIGEDGIAHFHGHAKASVELARGILKRLRFDNETISKILLLVELHDTFMDTTKKARRMLGKYGEEACKDLNAIRLADILGQSAFMQEEKLAELEASENALAEAIAEGTRLTVKALAVNGHDMIALGLEGQAIGRMLEFLLEAVCETPEINTQEKLMALANTVVMA